MSFSARTRGISRVCRSGLRTRSNRDSAFAPASSSAPRPTCGPSSRPTRSRRAAISTPADCWSSSLPANRRRTCANGYCGSKANPRNCAWQAANSISTTPTAWLVRRSPWALLRGYCRRPVPAGTGTLSGSYWRWRRAWTRLLTRGQALACPVHHTFLSKRFRNTQDTRVTSGGTLIDNLAFAGGGPINRIHDVLVSLETRRCRDHYFTIAADFPRTPAPRWGRCPGTGCRARAPSARCAGRGTSGSAFSTASPGSCMYIITRMRR
jgi:hypothetical protein